MANKAIAGGTATGAGIGLAAAISGLIVKLWWTSADADTVGYLTTVIGAALTVPSVVLSVYYTKMESGGEPPGNPGPSR